MHSHKLCHHSTVSSVESSPRSTEIPWLSLKSTLLGNNVRRDVLLCGTLGAQQPKSRMACEALSRSQGHGMPSAQRQPSPQKAGGFVENLHKVATQRSPPVPNTGKLSEQNSTVPPLSKSLYLKEGLPVYSSPSFTGLGETSTYTSAGLFRHVVRSCDFQLALWTAPVQPCIMVLYILPPKLAATR